MTTRVFSYSVALQEGAPPVTGEVEARNEADARRLLRVRYLIGRLPDDAVIVDRDAEAARREQQKSALLRQLLDILRKHHLWLTNDPHGVRADLSEMRLLGVNLAGADLRDAEMSQCELVNANLAGANLATANLSGSDLRGASLKGADLTGADLSECDLRDADLSSARLDRVDLWRANLRGVTIDPPALHAALGCRETG